MKDLLPRSFVWYPKDRFFGKDSKRPIINTIWGCTSHSSNDTWYSVTVLDTILFLFSRKLVAIVDTIIIQFVLYNIFVLDGAEKKKLKKINLTVFFPSFSVRREKKRKVFQRRPLLFF